MFDVNLNAVSFLAKTNDDIEIEKSNIENDLNNYKKAVASRGYYKPILF